MEELFYWHWYHSLKGITQKEKEELLRINENPGEWFLQAEKKNTKAIFIEETHSAEQEERKQEIISVLENRIQAESAKKSYDAMKLAGIHMTARNQPDYPRRLKHIYFPPQVLYYKGSLPKEEIPSIAVIGARNCSIYGEEIAAEFAKGLSNAGIQVISGMARGIDASAQRNAIGYPGSAYAVLGSGVDVCYPRDNFTLYQELCKRGGVISEEPPKTPPASFHFPKRNRIIAGLSDALLVVEARERSGSLITVSYALEQGKEIYAVPGRLNDRLAAGTNRLIQEGAYLVQSAEDILHNFLPDNYKICAKSEENKILLLETEEKIVYACLSLHPKHLEKIAEETQIPIPRLAELLFEMEQNNYIRQTIKNYYIAVQ